MTFLNMSNYNGDDKIYNIASVFNKTITVKNSISDSKRIICPFGDFSPVNCKDRIDF